MGRVMKGGTSGMRQDYLPPQPPIYDQPVSQDGPVMRPASTVNFDGATSGDGNDYRQVWKGFQRQPVQNTANNSGVGPGVYFACEHSKSTHKSKDALCAQVPGGGTPDDGAI